LALTAGDDPSVEQLLAEAMGHGCVPIVVGSVSPGFQGRIVDGVNGFVVGSEDRDDLLCGIRRLVDDPSLRAAMSERAHAAALDGRYRHDQMIQAFVSLFGHLHADVKNGAFRRTPGPLIPPPPAIGEFSVFPVDLGHKTDLGSFPTRRDAERFGEECGEVFEAARALAPSGEKVSAQTECDFAFQRR
jgi:hypothetical protein